MSSQTKITKYYAKIASCSFCGHRAEKGQKFVQGPGVYICEACVALCASVLSKRGVQERKYVPTDPTKKREIILCSFCGKDREEVRALFTRPGVHICNGCVDLCVAGLSKQPVPKGDSVPFSRVFCSFCGHHPVKGQKLVQGPGVYICEACVALGSEAIALEMKHNPEPKNDAETKQAPAQLRGIALCSFCGKRPEQAGALIAGPGVHVCDTCVADSVKIISGEWESAPGTKFTFPRLYHHKA